MGRREISTPGASVIAVKRPGYWRLTAARHKRKQSCFCECEAAGTASGVSRGVRGEEIKCATESVLWLSVLPASSERCFVFSVTVALGRTPTCTRIPSLLDIYRFISPPLVVTLFILCFTRGKINLGKPKSFVISMGPTHSVWRNTFVCFILRICWLTWCWPRARLKM